MLDELGSHELARRLWYYDIKGIKQEIDIND